MGTVQLSQTEADTTMQ